LFPPTTGRIVTVAAGGDHRFVFCLSSIPCADAGDNSLAVGAGGEVYAWGSNRYGTFFLSVGVLSSA
jgi:hypothetical protein